MATFPRPLTVLALLSPVLAPPVQAQVAELAELTADAASNSVGFGSAVALEGDRALIGADGSSRAYVFERNAAGDWIQVQMLWPVTTTSNSRFGQAVSLSGDRAVVGAPWDNTFGSQAGAAHVFERDAGGVWIHAAHLYGPEPSSTEQFGTSVSLLRNWALVGSPRQNVGGTDTGTASAFLHANGIWTQVVKLAPSGLGTLDHFGSAVTLSANPYTPLSFLGVVGAPLSNEVATDAGSVYAYRISAGLWPLENELTAADGNAGDRFGSSVANDGNRLLVGAPLHDHAGADAGAVFVFERTTPFGNYVQVAKLVPSDGSALTKFGSSVSLHHGLAFAGGPAVNPSPGSAQAFDLFPLSADENEVSLSAGGVQRMDVDAGHLHGSELYLLFGSASGWSPGLALGGGLVLPVNPDAYFSFTLAHANSPPLSDSVGFLNAFGHASPAFGLPPGMDPGLAGVNLVHAFATLALPALNATFVSNPLGVILAP